MVTSGRIKFTGVFCRFVESFFFLSTYKHKVEKIVQLGYDATSAHVICIFLSFPFFFFFSSFSKTSDVAGRQYDVEAAF
jgi:hypothetical protein